MSERLRSVVFISHATPEDNTFTLWLSTRLKLLGYEVWSDVTQLFGGERWWNDIEEALDLYTCKFVLVITRTSLSKPGVRREIEFALKAESKYELKNFIIPIIIDDSEFGGQPYDLSQRNIIPFSKSWGTGLARLTTRLTKDDVPTEISLKNLGSTISQLIQPSFAISNEPGVAVSNWLDTVALPQRLQFFRIPMEGRKWREQFSALPYPWFEWSGMLATFANLEDLTPHLPRHLSISSAPHLDIDAALENRPRNHPTFRLNEIINQMSYLLKEGWSLNMRSRGLHKYELSSGRHAWFFPSSEKYAGMREFPDINGVLRKKKVIGYSAKNSVYWHYAVEAIVQSGDKIQIVLIPHVVFTQDGMQPISDKAKMHSLRRGFCRSWWNDRWRDLLLAYLFMLSEGQESIQISLGPEQTAVFSSRPNLISTTFSLTGSGNTDTSEEEDVEVAGITSDIQHAT